MELTRFSPKIEDLQIRAYKRQSFTVYKLLSSIWQDIFFFISNRKTLIFTYFNVRGTHSLKLPLLLRSTRIFTLYVQASTQIHSDPDNVSRTFALSHAHIGDNALQWGLRWPKAAKHLQKFYPQ